MLISSRVFAYCMPNLTQVSKIKWALHGMDNALKLDTCVEFYEGGYGAGNSIGVDLPA